MPSFILRPSISLGLYPERPSPEAHADRHDFQIPPTRRRLSYQRLKEVARQVNHAGARLTSLDDNTLLDELASLRYLFLRQGLAQRLVVSAFALIREMSSRTLAMKHHDVQIMGAWAMFHGAIAEMETGEGKTLTATLTAATAALAGIPVHVITVNDYLAHRDASTVNALYRAINISVGCATQRNNDDERREAYRCDVVYCTNQQLAFDYLRDQLRLNAGRDRLSHLVDKLAPQASISVGLFLRGLCFAIVDEADSILVDGAITPLIIANEAQQREEELTYRRAFALSRTMTDSQDFTVCHKTRTVTMTERGLKKIRVLTSSLDGSWPAARWRDELVKTAIEAQHLYQRDEHYLVRDGSVEIIDQSTGRTLPDRAWQRGLHQMIELKENCSLTVQREPLAKLTYQAFFRRYLRLCGMSGTVREVGRELRTIYGLRTVTIPTHRLCLRRNHGTQVYSSRLAKYRVLLSRVRELHAIGRPVLIGTRSVDDSELISAIFSKAGLPHRVLNARQDKEEAIVIAKAGEKGAITVATNMAGRGTDIKLGAGVAALGGMHVICVEMNDAKRIDRQLHGRCARQGDPGSVETLLSLEDRNAALFLSLRMRKWLGLAMEQERLPSWIARHLMRLAQVVVERRHAKQRRNLLKSEENMQKYFTVTSK